MMKIAQVRQSPAFPRSGRFIGPDGDRRYPYGSGATPEQRLVTHSPDLESRILLVEDEPTTRKILTYMLRGEGYQMDSVGSAGAARTCLESIRYAVVISDWLLLDGSGIDVADAAADLGSKTLIISDFLSTLPGGAAERHDLLTKRLDPTLIVAAVRRAIADLQPDSQDRASQAG
jgi:DNA-binding response OmpR family regulator